MCFTENGVIYDCREGSVAEKQGMKPGSTVTSVDGERVDEDTWMEAFRNAKVPFLITVTSLPKFTITVKSRPFGFTYKGNLVTEVGADSLAAREGVTAGDVAVRINDRPVAPETFKTKYETSDLPMKLTFLSKDLQKFESKKGIDITVRGAAEAELNGVYQSTWSLAEEDDQEMLFCAEKTKGIRLQCVAAGHMALWTFSIDGVVQYKTQLPLNAVTYPINVPISGWQAQGPALRAGHNTTPTIEYVDDSQWPPIIAQKSAVASAFNVEHWNKYSKIRTTTANWSVRKGLTPACKYPNPRFGFAIGDEDCYTAFEEYFAAALGRFHGCPPKYVRDLDPFNLAVSFDSPKYVDRIRISIGRNVEGFAFTPGLSLIHI